jgi:hypothetical protein
MYLIVSRDGSIRLGTLENEVSVCEDVKTKEIRYVREGIPSLQKGSLVAATTGKRPQNDPWAWSKAPVIKEI